MFIDQLAMIVRKRAAISLPTKTKILRNALTNLQMAYVEVTQGGGVAAEPSLEATAAASPTADTASTPAPDAPDASSIAPPDESRESKKRFTKSYGS